MAINFFEANCTSQTNESVFGVYDVPPAELIFDNAHVWHLWIDNSGGVDITYTAIDKCLDIPYAEGERCEAMITYKDVLIFIELKDSDGGRWAGKSRDQLVNTIMLFKRDADITPFKRLYGHIANKQRPNFKAGSKTFYQEFEDKTGFILRVSDVLKIE
jgi:hypothetical protein